LLTGSCRLYGLGRLLRGEVGIECGVVALTLDQVVEPGAMDSPRKANPESTGDSGLRLSDGTYFSM